MDLKKLVQACNLAIEAGAESTFTYGIGQTLRNAYRAEVVKLFTGKAFCIDSQIVAYAYLSMFDKDEQRKAVKKLHALHKALRSLPAFPLKEVDGNKVEVLTVIPIPMGICIDVFVLKIPVLNLMSVIRTYNLKVLKTPHGDHFSMIKKVIEDVEKLDTWPKK